MHLLYLDPRQLESDPDGVREDLGDISGLAATIAEQGLLQPIGVVSIGGGRYRVVYGNRRRAAAEQAGLEKIPCIVLDADDPDLLLRQLIENVQRQELNDIEQARAFARLRARLAEEHGPLPEHDLDELVGATVGLSGRTVRRYLGLLDLPDDVQHLIRRRELNVTQAQHLRRVPNPKTQRELARFAVEEGLSAAELSRLAAYFAANPNLTLETALQALEAAETPRTAPAAGPEVTIRGGAPARNRVGTTARTHDEAEWDEKEEAEDFLDIEHKTVENRLPNKARVSRLRSLDQMVDEMDRMVRAYAEGDLARWVKSDEGAPFKMRLLLTQLERLSRGLRDLIRQQGWEIDEEL